MLNFDWLNNLPLGTAKLLMILAFAMPVIFTFGLKKKYIFSGSEDKKPWRNLKFWVLGISSIMIAIYIYF